MMNINIPHFLYVLFRSYKGPRANLKGEDLLCSTFVNQCVGWTLDGSLKAIWFHIGNENTNSLGMNSKLKALGRISGCPDYCFINKHRTIFLEFKSEKGKQTINQMAFEAWCLEIGISYFIIRSIEQAIKILQDNKFLDDKIK